MFYGNRLVVLVTLLLPIWLVACSPSEMETETLATAAAQAPRIDPVVPFGEPQMRNLQPTNEVVSNCGGINVPVVKHPSTIVGSSHSTEWEVGGSVGVGVEIGSDLLPAKIDVGGALEGSVVRDFGSIVQQGIVWDLPAEPGYIMDYTLMWQEEWQSGYIDVTYFDPEPEIFRINVTYRTRIVSNIVGQKAARCDEGLETAATSQALPGNPDALGETGTGLASSSTQTQLSLTPTGEICRLHDSGYCGLEIEVSWVGADLTNGRIYVVGYASNYGPNNGPLWWIAGTGVVPKASTGSEVVTDGAFGNPGDRIDIFACQTREEYLFSPAITKHEFSAKPDCIFTSDSITLNTR